jgi:hypothetical protein
MLKPGESFSHEMVIASTDAMIEALGIDVSQRAVRYVGRVEYTDSSGQLKPEFPLCYQVVTAKDDAGKVQTRLIAFCPGSEANVSR